MSMPMESCGGPGGSTGKGHSLSPNQIMFEQSWISDLSLLDCPEAAIHLCAGFLCHAIDILEGEVREWCGGR